MTTKKQLIAIISNFLKEFQSIEICVVKYQNKLRNGRYGMHAYSLCYRYLDTEDGGLYVRPWSGASIYNPARLERLTLSELYDIVDKCRYTSLR